MVGIAPVRGLVHPKCFQLGLSLVIWVGGGGDRRHLHCLHSDIQWWPLSDGLEHHRVATAVSQQSNDLRIEHFVLIASCS